MTRLYHFLLVILCLLALSAHTAAAADEVAQTDVVIYGATPAGIAAAVSAASGGSRVLLVEPTSRIGGLTTNGLSHPDFRTFEGLTGFYLDLTHRVKHYYENKYGADSPQARDCFHGTHGEPHVNLLVFEQMLAEQPTIRVITNRSLAGVEATSDGPQQRILSATFTSQDEQLTAQAAVFIDATYEGDLMAKAGVPFRVGREARDEYGESLAPENADEQVQGYNFRFVMTRDPQLRVLPAAPAGYQREDFAGVLPLLGTERVKSIFCDSTGGIYKAHLPALPNGKHDVNDVSRAPVRLSLPDINDAWPDGDSQVRQRIYDEHVRHNVGLLYFLQNDAAVPPKFRDEARQWGFCQDEFTDHDHRPHQLYVREARRMIGLHVFTENDTAYADDDARSMFKPDAIAIGDYGHNCHGTAHEGPRFGGRHSGEFYKSVPPYQIPYGVIVPRECRNLLVPTACSSSHVGFCALRLEPIWSSLGEAAGIAAHLAVVKKFHVQDVSPSAIQQRLHARGAATIYVSDVKSDSRDFIAVQWWGSLGGLHGLAPTPAKPGQRGEHLLGQYYAAYPRHAAQLDQPLDETLAARWRRIAKTAGADSSSLGAAETRRDFIRAAYDEWTRPAGGGE